MNVQTVSIEVGGRPLTIETGKLAKQANGSVVIRQDDSMILVTACAGKTDVPFDFLPLTVIYQDRTAASGSIPGGFLKREGRPNERETLISRLIDRPIRPQFPKYFRREMQVIATVMSYDPASDTDVLAMCATAAAFAVSDIPMTDPIAGVRIIRLNGEFLINPSLAQLADSDINLVVAGSRAGISMVEGAASEAPEEAMMEAMELAFTEIQKIIDGIEELAALVNPTKFEIDAPADLNEEVKGKLMALGAQDKLNDAMGIPGKFERGTGLKNTRNELIAGLVVGEEDANTVTSITKDAKKIWDKMVSETMRRNVVESGIRIDGRQTDEIRHIWMEVGMAPRVHGSTIFTRGETQAFVTATLGTARDAQHVDFADEKEDRRWMLQYNFPPYSTGEVRRMMGPKRREIGHGNLAHRALQPVFPSAEEYKYVVRCSSDVLESNGSSSMATVCGATLSMYDAGVPLKAPVAGIAMGLIKVDDNYVVLSDILGDEDHLGDMDFKVAGTEDGITSLQMDIKITSITKEIMEIALDQAKEGRIHILNEMSKAIGSSREALADTAPKITTMKIKVEKIRDVIGPGGKMIREICELTGAKVDIEDDGTIKIAASDTESSLAAQKKINEIVAEAELGVIYDGKVVKTVDFGAFVNFLGTKDGLVHISELQNARTQKTTDICKEGDTVKVKVIGFDDRGKVKLSMKRVDQETGADIEDKKEEE